MIFFYEYKNQINTLQFWVLVTYNQKPVLNDPISCATLGNSNNAELWNYVKNWTHKNFTKS